MLSVNNSKRFTFVNGSHMSASRNFLWLFIKFSSISISLSLMMPDYFAYLCIVVKIATIDELDEVVDLKMSIAYHIFGSY